MNARRRPRVGLALGSGAARGWAHVGVIRALEQVGIRPDFVCGTSIGALVGAAYAAGELDHFEQWVLGLEIKDVVAYIDLSLSSGLIKGERLMEFFQNNFADCPLEALPLPFAAVATSLRTGAEVWLRHGSTIDAVRASIALPGLFAPVLWEGTVVVDGGLVNPVPVSLARAMGADVVIAVDLSSDVLGHHPPEDPRPESAPADNSDWVGKLRDNLAALVPARSSDGPKMPSILEVMASSINIMQVKIARSRLAGDPPDLIVAPRLAHFDLIDFHRGKEAIEEGKRAVERVAHSLSALDIRAS